jgi:hypothetical protein
VSLITFNEGVENVFLWLADVPHNQQTHLLNVEDLLGFVSSLSQSGVTVDTRQTE